MNSLRKLFRLFRKKPAKKEERTKTSPKPKCQKIFVLYIRMNNTRKNKIICYTGIGARKNAKHSANTFRKITRKLYPMAECKRMKNYKNKYGSGSECPKNGNINGWVNYFGAEYTSPNNCNSIVKNNKAIHNQLNPK